MSDRTCPKIRGDRLVPADEHDALLAAAREVSSWLAVYSSGQWDGMDVHAGLIRSGRALRDALDRYPSIREARAVA